MEAAVFGGAPVPGGLTDKERGGARCVPRAVHEGLHRRAGPVAANDRFSLTDSPVGLAAWMLDHDTDSYEKISRAFAGGQPAGGLTRDKIVDNITLYWLTGTATPAARLYWEGARSAAAAVGQMPPEVLLPFGFAVVTHA